MRPLVDLLAYAALLVVELLVRCLSPAGAERLGRAAGRVWFGLDRRRRDRARTSLAIARRGGLRFGCGEDLVRTCFESLIRVPIEAFLFPRFFPSARELKRRCACRGDWAALRRDLQAGTGGLLVSGHLGNWEVLGWGMRFLGVPCRVVARPIENRWIERRALGLRGGTGGVIPKGGAVRAILRTLRGRGWVGFLGDQYAGRHGVCVSFFGRSASTYPAPAVLAERTGVPVYAAACLRLPRSSDRWFEIHLSRLPEPPPGTPEAETVPFRLRAFLAVLEGWIQRAPEQYNWVHRRWR